jgi:hypothetical protein
LLAIIRSQYLVIVDMSLACAVCALYLTGGMYQPQLRVSA